MKRTFIAISQTDSDLGIALNSWETFTGFTVVQETVDSIFMHSVDTHTFLLKERGLYSVSIVLNLESDIETSAGIEVRLSIDGTPRPVMAKGFLENTIAFHDSFTISEATEMIIEVYLSSDDTPVIGAIGGDMIEIKKAI